MASFNKVILLGNLTRDPETRVTPGGLSICKLALAVNRRFRTKEGEQREEVTYVDIDAFGAQAETISKYASKGTAILVEGRLRLDQWENQQGEKRRQLTVVLENFQFAGGGRGESGGGSGDGGSGGGYENSSPPRRSGGGGSGGGGRSAPPSKSEPAADFEEDVPF